jgi:hypothetical protein
LSIGFDKIETGIAVFSKFIQMVDVSTDVYDQCKTCTSLKKVQTMFRQACQASPSLAKPSQTSPNLKPSSCFHFFPIIFIIDLAFIYK